ncbi:MAG TPA: hypothetical protein PLS50_08245, partial [Candidatus Dojkabacteria bacterium]|nr:hypothetical protein [Candidatus Dojkabacteria bacterium]
MKKQIVSLLGVIWFLFLAVASKPEKIFVDKPTLKVEITPNTRCPGRDVHVSWETSSGHGIKISTNPAVEHIDELNSLSEFRNSIGEYTISGTFLDENMASSSYELVFTAVPLTGLGPMSDAHREEVSTIHGEQVIERSASGEPNAENMMMYRFDPTGDEFDEDLDVTEIWITKGCDGDSPSGSYSVSRGLETPENIIFNGENDFKVRFGEPKQLVGLWIFRPVGANCDKRHKEIS